MLRGADGGEAVKGVPEGSGDGVSPAAVNLGVAAQSDSTFSRNQALICVEAK